MRCPLPAVTVFFAAGCVIDLGCVHMCEPACARTYLCVYACVHACLRLPMCIYTIF